MFKAVLNVPSAEPMDIRWFYNKYAAMLLGYISPIVQDNQKAEELLSNILTSFTREFKVQERQTPNIWFKLRQHAQNKLSEYTVKPIQQSKNLEVLNELEREIFCGVYYHGKSIVFLANSLAKNEDDIRNQLRLSIDKMRRVRGN